MTFAFAESEKFSLLVIDGCYSDVDSEVVLHDDTTVLPKMPEDIDDQWKRWIGEIHCDSLTRANSVLVRRIKSAKPHLLDEEHGELYERVMDVFTALQLSNVVYYHDASALQGSFEHGRVNVREMIRPERFYLSAKSPQYPVTIPRLEEAAAIADAWRRVTASGSYQRFIRGFVALRRGLTLEYGEDRIHQFSRAIEALIRPEVGGTTKQFKKRGQVLGTKSSSAEKILYESYEMRCDVEHMHAVDRFLSKNYSAHEVEQVATLRTRQMERLACEFYRRILLNDDIRAHFETDESMRSFWDLSFDDQRRIWGPPIDVTSFADDDEEQEKLRQIRERHPR